MGHAGLTVGPPDGPGPACRLGLPRESTRSGPRAGAVRSSPGVPETRQAEYGAAPRGRVGQRTLDGGDISELREEYDRKVNEELPAVARRSDGWPIRLDHCFGRVVLDTLFEDEWYDHVDGRPAVESLSREELRAAVDVADRMLEGGRPVVEELNRNSLRWRDEL